MIHQTIEEIKKSTDKLVVCSEKLKQLYDECDYERLISTAIKGLTLTSKLYLLHRHLLVALYEALPSLRRKSVDIDSLAREALDISVEELTMLETPVYKISLPCLLPNKRQRADAYKNAITYSVYHAVRQFCVEHRILPFYQATVIFLSRCPSDHYSVDNDNKEAAVIMNGLIGNLLYDDSPAACNTCYYNRKIEILSEPRTEIYVVDSSYDVELLSWIKDQA